MASTYRDRVYNVGIICALATEKAAVVATLDETYVKSMQLPGDENAYFLGRIGSHNVAIACLPAGAIGKVSAATVARDMMRSFPIKIGLMVGIAGGVWSKTRDVRLGDVVVSQPEGNHGGVVQWDFGKWERDGVFQRRGMLNKPPGVLLGAVQAVQTEEYVSGSGIPSILSQTTQNHPAMQKRFSRPPPEDDKLYESSYQHLAGDTCDGCSDQHLVDRPQRDDLDPSIHYGNIASGDSVIKDGPTRDRIAGSEDVICFEMEACGLMNSFPCLVIRGICDYADSHKNKRWQPYTALTAAAYAKWLLQFVGLPSLQKLPTVSASTFEIPFSLEGVPVTSRFVGRKLELQYMESILFPQQAAPSRRVVFVIHGMGGMGKTQLSIEYARQHANRYTAVFWVNGSSKARINQSLLEFVQRIPPAQLSEKMTSIIKNTSKRTAENEDSLDLKHDIIVEELHRWLRQSQNTKWLMIIDNIDREHEEGSVSPREPPFSGLTKLIPAGDHGTVVVTTRLLSLRTLFRAGLKINTMSKQDAQAILQQHEFGETISDIELLIERLHGLPLALAQARAFIEQMGITIAAYVKHWDTEWHALMQKQSRFPLPEYGEEREERTARSILTTWKISYDQVRKESETAAGLMKLWAFLDCNDLWFDLVASAQNLETMPSWLAQAARSELDFLSAMGLLNKYSLVEGKESKGKTSAYSMHAVLHKWCTGLTENEKEDDDVHWLAMRLVGANVLTGSAHNYRSYDRRLLPHIVQLYRHKARGPRDRAELSAMISMSGVLIRQGRFDEAKDVTEWAIQVCEKILGAADGLTLSALHHSAWVLAEDGHLTAAESRYRKALDGKIAMSGVDDTSTLKTLRNLGQLLIRQKCYDQALELFRQALNHISKRRPATTVDCDILDNSGMLFMKIGSIQESLSSYERACAAKVRILGKDHLSTLDTVYNLACVCMAELDYVKAEKLLRQVLEGRGKPEALGENHLETAIAAHTLGKVLSAQRQWVEAASFYDRALHGFSSVITTSEVRDERMNEIRADMSRLRQDQAANFSPRSGKSSGRASNVVKRYWSHLMARLSSKRKGGQTPSLPVEELSGSMSDSSSHRREPLSSRGLELVYYAGPDTNSPNPPPPPQIGPWQFEK